jgi:SAM-dependent methyltransferase
VVDLGCQPLSNAYLDGAGPVDEEPRYPLHARFCEQCFLVQVDDVVPPDRIFTDYAYFSSVSESWVTHASEFAEEASKRLRLGPSSFVVEIASNDGYLLSEFVRRGIPSLGVEPAANVAAVAVERGVPTDVRFFGAEVARELAERHRRADLIVANNVLAHVPDLNDFVRGLAILLAPSGRISVEVPHLLQLLRGAQFDTIYHEHFSYFSLLAADGVFSRHGLRIADVVPLPTHGGSIRISVVHHDSPLETDARVGAMLDEERASSLDRYEGFAGFASRVEACRAALVDFLQTAKREGRRVAGYGAAAKGNTLLNYAHVGPDLLEFVADRSPYKQGRRLPGSHIPVVPPSRIEIERPDEILILPWNLKDEIVDQLAYVRGWGGRFLVAVPHVEFVR